MLLAGVGRAPTLLPKTTGFFPKHCWEPQRSTMGECQSRLGEMYPVSYHIPYTGLLHICSDFPAGEQKIPLHGAANGRFKRAAGFISYCYYCFDEEGGKASCHLLLMACGSMGQMHHKAGAD